MKLELDRIIQDGSQIVAVLKPTTTGREASIICDELRKLLDEQSLEYQPVAFFHRIGPLSAKIKLYFQLYGVNKPFSAAVYPDELSALLPTLKLLEAYNAAQD